MARKKNKKQKVMSDSSDKENMDGITTPHDPVARGRTHPGGNSKGTCTQRSISPAVTGQSATGHSPTGQEDITDRPLATGHWPTGHYTEYFKSVSHRSQVI